MSTQRNDPRTPPLAALRLRKTTKIVQMAVIAGALVALSACSQRAPNSTTVYNGELPDASVDMQQVQVAYLGSGNGGSGVLHFRGQDYPFTVGGLGVGGIGVSSIKATGVVYHLANVAQFAGSYVQGRYGIAVGTASTGDLWLQNDAGVVMHLQAQRKGLMLSLGGDVIVITMGQAS